MILAGTALLTQASKAWFRDILEGVTLIIPNSGEIGKVGECLAQPVLCGAWDGIRELQCLVPLSRRAFLEERLPGQHCPHVPPSSSSPLLTPPSSKETSAELI